MEATAKLHHPPERNCRLEEGESSFFRRIGINLSYKAKKNPKDCHLSNTRLQKLRTWPLILRNNRTLSNPYH